MIPPYLFSLVTMINDTLIQDTGERKILEPVVTHSGSNRGQS